MIMQQHTTTWRGRQFTYNDTVTVLLRYYRGHALPRATWPHAPYAHRVTLHTATRSAPLTTLPNTHPTPPHPFPFDARLPPHVRTRPLGALWTGAAHWHWRTEGGTLNLPAAQKTLLPNSAPLPFLTTRRVTQFHLTHHTAAHAFPYYHHALPFHIHRTLSCLWHTGV